MTTLFPEVIMLPNVGHRNVSDGVELKDGMYAISASPVVLKSLPQMVTFISSGFVNKIVKTEH